MLKPPKKQTVSNWAEENRFLGSQDSAFSGRWQNAITPYLIEIMDTFNDPNIHESIVVKPSQVGGTEALNNIIAYIISESPAPTLMVYPTSELAKQTGDNRIKPMVKESPALRQKFNEKKSKQKELKFTGMTIYMATAGSVSELSSKHIKYLFIDEEDKILKDFQSEGDPVKLAYERTKTYSNQNRKIYRISTPTTKYGRIWKAMEQADVVKKLTVKCPVCGEYIKLEFENLKWNKNKSGTDIAKVWYECDRCKSEISEHEQYLMLKNVKWIVFTKNREKAQKVAFWFNTLYSPFVTWRQVVEEFLSSKDDPSTLQNFVNSWLAEPWEESSNEVEEVIIERSQTDCKRFIVPEWAELLTAGVDVQKSSLYYTIKAWGKNITSQVIDNGQVLSFSDIELIMNRYYQNEKGENLQVSLCAVDSGDQTDDVYEFCELNSDWAIPIKGSSRGLNGYYNISNTKNQQPHFGER